MRHGTRRVKALSLLAGAALALTACNGAGAEQDVAAEQGMVDYIDLGGFGGGTSPQENYNPYSLNRLTADYMHETLYQINAYDCSETPWLATDYEWQDGKTLVFTIRDGVRWSDGKPFSAEDVAYSFNLVIDHPELDQWGVGQYLGSVEAKGNKAVFHFDTASVPTFVEIADATKIVPKHIWSKAKNPVTFTDKDPVGTGPYTVKSFNPRQLTLEKNDDYWQADKVKVQELRFHTPDEGGQVDKLKLARGEFDTNRMFVPDIEKTYVSKDPEHNKYWFPPGGYISLAMNLTEKPFDDVAFRKAMTYAVDKDEIKNKAEFGYVETASQTGLVVPGQSDWLADGVENQGKLPFDQDKADQMLTDAGYERNATGHRLGKDGKPMSFELMVPSGWSDWIQAAQVIRDNLGELGINVKVQTPAAETHDNDRAIGKYDMFFGVYGGTCNMFKNFHDPLDSRSTAPIGKQAPTNWIRFSDPKVDGLLDKLRTATDEKSQHEAVDGLQQVMLDQAPLVPLWYGAKWFQYRTEKTVGWPNAENPYADPDHTLLIITHLKPASGS